MTKWMLFPQCSDHMVTDVVNRHLKPEFLAFSVNRLCFIFQKHVNKGIKLISPIGLYSMFRDGLYNYVPVF
jgi:hypothetical protein